MRHDHPPWQDVAWREAVVRGAQGRYDESWSLLEERGLEDCAALSLHASHLRQLGEYAEACAQDERAVLCAVDAEQRADALIGLAADMLGLGDLDTCRELLHRARSEADSHWRTRTRLAWVNAELSLAQGVPAKARSHADDAVASCRGKSARHLAKSQIVRGAVLFAMGAEHATGVSVGSAEPPRLATGVADLAAGSDAALEGALATLLWPAALIALDAVPAAGAASERALARIADRGPAAVAFIAHHLPGPLASRWQARPDVARLVPVLPR